MTVKAYANGKGIKIIGDVPIYVALDSSDVWASPDQFRLDRDNFPTSVAGVPPDYFSADGQLWGNPLYDWKKMKADGFSWWKERMGLMCELFDGVRIDHFRGIESYFSIPATSDTAKNGKWVKGPGMAFVRAMKEVAAEKLIIAEDLGDITPAVNKLVKDSGFPGMRVLQFAFLGDENSPHLPHNYSDNCVAYTGTHDNNTLLGYVWESDEEVRQRLFNYVGYKSDDRDGSYESIMRVVFSSHAPLLMLPVQDLLFFGSDTRLNRPGSAEGNWSYRVTKEQIGNIDVNRLAFWNKTYGRMK
jgi:4-alpha-glucanotransferase